MKYRWINKIYAATMNYFWLPCPLCGQMFGGHEAYWGLKTSINTGKAVCLECAGEAKILNMKNFGVSE